MWLTPSDAPSPPQALLRRVFGTAIELWQDEVRWLSCMPMNRTSGPAGRLQPPKHMCPTNAPSHAPGQVGMRLHERNHKRLLACWSAWQLAVLEAQALRRQAILWNAAAAFRCAVCGGFT